MATLLAHQPSSTPKPKTHISVGHLPPFISAKDPPTRQSPWRQIRSMPFISSLTLTLPTALLHTTLQPLLLHPPPTYAKLILTLTDILTTAFFTTYIKTGTVLLISEGRPGVSDWVCHLHDGRLRIEMARELYERCGIQGVPADRNGGGRKHGRDRWVVDLDLRDPAMVRGRKGFERLVRAADQVLNQSKVWLFRDLGGGEKGGDGDTVINRFHPTVVDMDPKIMSRENVRVPKKVLTTMARDTAATTTSLSVTATATATATAATAGPPPEELHDEYHDLTEWLDLVNLGSPRVTSTDDPDPYISRYSVPDSDTATTADLTVVRWQGLLDRAWCMELLVGIVRHCRDVKGAEVEAEEDRWVACSVASHRTEALGQVDGCVVLLRPGVEAEDGESGRDGGGDVSMDEGGSSTTTGGLTHFTCFQFVDTVP